jgi:predicted esterase
MLTLGRGSPRPAALLAMSGFIPQVEGFELDLEPPFPPIATVHGEYDPVISVEFSRTARAELERAGASVLYREVPVDHTIDPSVIPELRQLVSAATTI